MSEIKKQGKFISKETVAKINLLSPETLSAHGIIQLVPNKNAEYVCPFCNNGGNGNRDATGIKPKIYPSHVGWKCHRCEEKFDNLRIFALHFGLNVRADFVSLCEKICAEFNLPLEYQMPITAEKKSEVPPAELNLINQDLASSSDALKIFVKQCGGTFRGLPFEILDRFGCRYIENWTPPKTRAAQIFTTPTPRIIIPANADGLHSNYLSRLTVPKDSFDEQTRQYIREKQHAGKKTLFNAAVLNSNEIIFCVEGYIDAMTIEYAGFPAVALGGADGGNLLVDALKSLQEKPKIIILFDPDDTGRKLAPRLQKDLLKIGCPSVVKFLSETDSKIDANQILQENDDYYLMQELFQIQQSAIEEFKTFEEKISDFNLSFNFDFADIFKGGGDDKRNGERIALFCEDKIRWLEDSELWTTYKDGIWLSRSEKNSCIIPFVNQMADVLSQNADSNHDKAVANIYTEQKKVNAALFFLKGCKEILISSKDLNQHKNLLCVKNCVIDLQTGETYPLSHKFLITNQCNVSFDKNADTAFVKKFLADILPNEQTLRAVLRYLGYCLTGEKNYHISHFWRGKGANGKSTLIDLLIKLLGTYAVKLPSNALIQSNRPFDANNPQPAIAILDGDVRLAILDEIMRNCRLDAALFKTITGDEFMTARGLYVNLKKFEIRAKLILNGNHLPTFDIDDGGLQRRINNVEFTQQFLGDDADPFLPQKLSLPENRSAFLKILVDEAKNFYRDGLIESAAMIDAKKEYFAENDFISDFITDFCSVGDGGEISRKAFEEKISANFPREFSRLKKKELLNLLIEKLAPKGVTYSKAHGNKNVFKNIRWLDSDE